MQLQIEQTLRFSHGTVQLATVKWDPVALVRPPHPDYHLCQRLSKDHAPLRIGNLRAREAFPRERSVGFLPRGCAVKLLPVESPLRVLDCSFSPEFFERTTGLTPGHWDRHTGSLVSIRNRRLEVLMQEIYAELMQPGFAHEMLIEAVTTMLLVELARYARQLDRRSARPGAGLALAPWQLRRIQERIRAAGELGYPKLGELAALCGISQSHLMRTFKAATGWQIHKYVAEDRLNAAKRLLAEEHASARDIAERLGFRSPAYFATAFRRMTGKTPSEFRSEARARPLNPAGAGTG